MASLSNLIEKRLRDIGAKPGDLRRELERVGASLARQSIHAWLTGESRPNTANMLALFDVLLVPADQQRLWWDAHAKWTPSKGSPPPPSRLDEDDIPTVVDPTPVP